eukprot:gnl/Hemi2/22466_TR7484_c0_g1_i1.p1 gnl/Hemi2/22466_TR7484_c0_g1~~gnl/Hemi2/22466_TR7484_c0_g1_i1.p1  ORF type:complete len:117 (-),score=2.62 gnl/Hemi2/22466_TR7484_c0_g1_i1:157-507(-)
MGTCCCRGDSTRNEEPLTDDETLERRRRSVQQRGSVKFTRIKDRIRPMSISSVEFVERPSAQAARPPSYQQFKERAQVAPTPSYMTGSDSDRSVKWNPRDPFYNPISRRASREASY